MRYFFIVYLCSKQDICLEMGDSISDLLEKEQVELMIIYGDTDVEEP